MVRAFTTSSNNSQRTSANLEYRDRVQNSKKYQSGEKDMDELCSELRAKARCSGSGAVIEKTEVDKILGPSDPDKQDFLSMFR